MSVVHPLLLGGLLLVAIPIIIHLILQQKPKHLIFPAFRFLQEKMKTTRRRLQLRHLLLLLLRILLVVLMCLAMARLKLFDERLNFSTDSPVAVALLFDTSSSMEYNVNHKSRLDDAKAKAREFLAGLPEGSKVAVFDSADLGGEWAKSVAEARDQVERLQVRPGNAPLTRQVQQAFRLLESATREDDAGAAPPPRLLLVFSDRTQASWDDNEARGLVRPPTVNAVFLDVGVDQPADLAITGLELSKEVLGAGEKLEVRVFVQATGMDADTSLTCRVDDKQAGEQKAVKLKADSREVILFEVKTDDMSAGPHKVEVRFAATDSLPFDDLRYATFEIRSGRKVLLLADNPRDARLWKLALEAMKVFGCDVMEAAKAGALDVNEKLLPEYKAVCLINVAQPDAGLWNLLEAYVQRGGKLAVVPGSLSTNLDDYNLGGKVLPAKLVRTLETPKLEPAVPWDWNLVGRPHPLLARFLEWKQTANIDFFQPALFPQAVRYWEAQADGGVIVPYADEAHHPALLERQLGQGRVLLFTTGMDARKDKDDRWYWNNYNASSFLFVLINESVAYLVGDLERPSLNRVCGEPVHVELPATPRFPFYTLTGPGITGATATVTRPADQNTVPITQAALPGNYTLADKDNPRVAGFSLNVKSDECQLGRVDVARITDLLGADSVLPVDRAVDLRDMLQGHWKQPIELLPYLMMLLLLVLALENLLANKFYRNQDQAASTAEAGPSPDRAFLGSLGQVLIGAGGGALLGLVVGFVVGTVHSGSWGVLPWV
ncbi:MAG TPA: VWA domain-containing protein, partial [Gemmataceae bacterium]|nr:VWA domain-containing protein [Gemmataceae bacterium]